MNIETIMSKVIVTVEMDDSLETIKEIFDNVPFHHILILESGKLFGLISKTDLYKSLSPYIGTISETNSDAALLKKRAHQIMERKPLTLKASDSVYDAVKLFNKNKISCIPVINDAGRPIGVVSWRDILKIIKPGMLTDASIPPNAQALDAN